MENRQGTPPSQPPRKSPKTFPIFYFLFSIFTIALLSSCAAPGEPYERKALTPTSVTDLAATQIGNDVVLTFTLPKESVDHRKLKQPPTIEIFRDFRSTPAAPATPILLTTIPSDMVVHIAAKDTARYQDTLAPQNFAQHPDATVMYFVRTRTSDKKVSANSNAVTLRVIPAALPIADLQASVVHAGIDLHWTPPQKTLDGSAPSISTYRIYRAEAKMAAAQVAPPFAAQKSPVMPPLLHIGDSSGPPFRDLQTEFGQTYIYSIRSVISDGHLQIESADSNLVTVTPRDIFPPTTPQGLLVVLVPARDGSPAYLELSWSISADNDIAGYNIYRSEASGTPGQKLNPELLLTPAFRDMNVLPGRDYFYTVTAVDRARNESPASAPASGQLPAEVPAEVPTEVPERDSPKQPPAESSPKS
jgi:hypothetical protein